MPTNDLDAAPPPEADGALIGGRYRLGEPIGTGGSAAVYVADDIERADGARVAVKLLHPHLCASDAARAAFLAEAERAGRLDHPNIVRIHGYGIHDAGGVLMPWIALELLDGPTLREWVELTGRLSPADAVAVLDGTLAGLAHAHAAGLVHRDLTPQNIILVGAHDRTTGSRITPGMIRIVDFGLADATGRATLGGDILLAEDGDHVVGSAAFMSPEQAQGLPVRSVSDLYQAGCLLYFAVTGRTPFPRSSTPEVLRAHQTAPAPIASVHVPAARSLDRIIARALAKTPAHRYRTADEFRTALHEAAAAPALSDELSLGIHDGDGDGPTRRYTSIAPVVVSTGDLDYLRATEDTAPAPARSGVTAPTAVIAGTVVVALLGIGVVAAVANPDVESTASSTPRATVIEPTTAPVEEPAQAAPSMVAVPTLTGTLSDVQAALGDAGLTLGTVTRVESDRPADQLLGQYPAAGTSVTAGTAVDVTIASGSNVIPQVTGMTLAAATALMESHGFAAVASPIDADSTRMVASTQPDAGAVMRLGVTITLIAATPSEPTPSPTGTTPAGDGSES